jgi:hypothetical protein
MISLAEEYAKKKLEDAGINFEEIQEKNILMTCQGYHGIITKKNKEAVISAVKNIYEEVSK